MGMPGLPTPRLHSPASNTTTGTPGSLAPVTAGGHRGHRGVNRRPHGGNGRLSQLFFWGQCVPASASLVWDAAGADSSKVTVRADCRRRLLTLSSSRISSSDANAAKTAASSAHTTHIVSRPNALVLDFAQIR